MQIGGWIGLKSSRQRPQRGAPPGRRQTRQCGGKTRSTSPRSTLFSSVGLQRDTRCAAGRRRILEIFLAPTCVQHVKRRREVFCAVGESGSSSSSCRVSHCSPTEDLMSPPSRRPRNVAPISLGPSRAWQNSQRMRLARRRRHGFDVPPRPVQPRIFSRTAPSSTSLPTTRRPSR